VEWGLDGWVAGLLGGQAVCSLWCAKGKEFKFCLQGDLRALKCGRPCGRPIDTPYWGSFQDGPPKGVKGWGIADLITLGSPWSPLAVRTWLHCLFETSQHHCFGFWGDERRCQPWMLFGLKCVDFCIERESNLYNGLFLLGKLFCFVPNSVPSQSTLRQNLSAFWKVPNELRGKSGQFKIFHVLRNWRNGVWTTHCRKEED
jgi:hypothetical protein